MAFSTSSGDTSQVQASINVVPLIDVLLVLLIIFMVTAPLMSHKIEVELPKAVIGPREPEILKATPISLTVKADGSLFWNDEPISEALLESRLSVEAQKTPQPQINVRGDTTTKYRIVQEVVKIAQAQGMRKVGFVAERDRR